MSAATWTDEAGHPWPVTGEWCAACGLPLIPHYEGQEVHPLCQDSPCN